MRLLRKLTAVAIALGFGTFLAAAKKGPDYVLIGVTDKQAIFADRASIKKTGAEAVGTLLAVYVPDRQGIQFVETQTEFQCNSMLVRSTGGRAYSEGDSKGSFFAVGNDMRSIDKKSPLFTFREMACQGRAPGTLPRAQSRRAAVRLATSQVAELARGR